MTSILCSLPLYLYIRASAVVPIPSLFVAAPFATLTVFILTPQPVPIAQILHIGIGIFILGIIIPVKIFIVAILICLVFDL
jgi:hypothetical protein